MAATPRPISPPPTKYLIAEAGRVFGSISALFFTFPMLRSAPRGDGHPVLVLPGFLSGDAPTLPLRLYLRSLGYEAHGWDLGINLGRGIDPENVIPADSKTLARVRQLHEQTGRKVTLIGWSLGGIYAREIARITPDSVRMVITLASPFRGERRSNNIWKTFERVSGHKLDDLSDELYERSSKSPPVPTTAIYSRTDGITAWETCIDELEGCIDCENIELETSHLGIGFSPIALWAIADRLAQPEGEWKPFDCSGIKRYLYRNWLG
ncbi:MAG: esterase/lipase family protein [Candidatus Promineifilaceae bacterium]